MGKGKWEMGNGVVFGEGGKEKVNFLGGKKEESEYKERWRKK